MRLQLKQKGGETVACRDAYKNKIIKDRKLEGAEIQDGFSIP